MARRGGSGAWDTRVGRNAVDSRWVLVLTLYFLLLTIVLVYSAIAIWPQTPEPGVITDGDALVDPRPQWFGAAVMMTREQNLLVLVGLLGALGAMGHVLRSFFMYVGERNLVWSWVASYVVIPFLGAVLAVIAYILLRAGLISGGAQDGNVWGFAAVAALVGLFNGQAASKLKDVFEVIFAPTEPRGDSLRGDEQPTIVEISPASGRPSDPVVISGAGLAAVTEVIFGGDVRSRATFDPGSGELRTEVPAGAQSGPVTVSVGSFTAASPTDFEVTEP